MAGYVKFDGIDGESLDDKHKGWIEVESFSQSIHKPTMSGATGSLRRRGDVELSDIVIVKVLDKSSPKLAEAVCNGKVFKDVKIEVTASYTDSGRVTYYAYKLDNVQVVSYSINGHTQAEAVPTESITLNFEKIKVTYTENDEKGKKKGNVEYEWDVQAGKK